MHGEWIDRLAAYQTRPFSTRDTDDPRRAAGRCAARIYQPEVARARTVLLTGGVHAKGIDEPRLVKLAGDLAAGGTPVVTAEVPDLLRYRITPQLTDAHRRRGRLGLVAAGLRARRHASASSGSASPAACRSARRGGRGSATTSPTCVSFGGHGDLVRTVRFLCSGQQADGQFRKPHDYGVVVALINVADRVVPPEQVEPLRAAIVSFMTASHLDMVDKPAAKLEFEHAMSAAADAARAGGDADGLRQHAEREGARRAAAAVRRRLRQRSGALTGDCAGGDRARVPAPRRRRQRGAGGRVTLLARALEGRVPVHLLVTPLITHAEVDRPATAREVWNLMRFWYARGEGG